MRELLGAPVGVDGCVAPIPRIILGCRSGANGLVSSDLGEAPEAMDGRLGTNMTSAKPSLAATPTVDVMTKLKQAVRLSCEPSSLTPGGDRSRDLDLASQLYDLTREARRALFPDRSPIIGEDFAFLLRYLTTTTTIEEAIKGIVEFGEAYWRDLATMWIEETKGRVAIRWRVHSQDRPNVFIHELRAAAINLGALNWLSGGKLTDMSAEFVGAPLADDEIRRIFPYDIEHIGEATGVSVRREDLRKPVIRAPNEVKDFIQHASIIAIFGVDYRRSFHEEVEVILERELRLHSRAPSLDVICDLLFTSPATLHRRLRTEGFSFREIRDEILNRVAKQLLADTTSTVSVVSERLGYSEERPFRRSFMRWNGCSPAAYRAREEGRRAALAA